MSSLCALWKTFTITPLRNMSSFLLSHQFLRSQCVPRSQQSVPRTWLDSILVSHHSQKFCDIWLWGQISESTKKNKWINKTIIQVNFIWPHLNLPLRLSNRYKCSGSVTVCTRVLFILQFSFWHQETKATPNKKVTWHVIDFFLSQFFVAFYFNR